MTIDIPRSRQACTANPTHPGWTYERYYLGEPDGRWARLTIGGLVHRRSTLTYEGAGKGCHVTGRRFFSGTRDELASSSEVLKDREYLRQYHPECL